MNMSFVMAKAMMCDCGWTIVSPAGEADVMKHAKMHVMDAHPGMKISDQDFKKMMKTV
jgi:predicted small metal-binding protein